MTYEVEKIAGVGNVGYMESVIRGSVAIAIVVALVLESSIGSYLMFGLTQLAIYAGLTAFIGWDPIYAMMKQRETRMLRHAAVPDTVSAQTDTASDSAEHKRAA